WQMVEDAGRGWRKVVASPMPQRIIGCHLLKRLVESGAVLVAGGGGGVPVYKDVGGYYRGVEAVIDKDYVASMLACELTADLFIMLTQVPMVAENFGRPNQHWLRRMPLSKAREMMASHQFPPGSMGPKVQASMDFVEATGKEVLITDEDSLKQALDGRAGTFLVADGEVEYAALA
ncbi:MAG: carbamate kinase, partial [Robiginitalea sp.]